MIPDVRANSLARARVLQAMKAVKSLPGVAWWFVVTEMERNGYTHSAMGAAIGVPRTTVEGWKNRNAEPAHVDGERLCALWRVVTGRPAEELPRKLGDVLSAACFK